MSGECWGPWIEHDGKGTPPDVIGAFVHMVGSQSQAMYMIRKPYPGFDWSNFGKPVNGGGWDKVLRYRIRKPRALIQLIDMVENLPAPTERVEA